MKRNLIVLIVLAVAVMFLAVPPAYAGTTERVSVDSNGNQANSSSRDWLAISADGRYVAFGSQASNLVPGDTNGRRDVFVHDRQTGTTERVSVDSNGNQANDNSDIPYISADGRYVSFRSWATNLVPGDTNWRSDVFVHDRQTGTTERVNVDSNGNQANQHSGDSPISADGRYVAFQSNASNLVPGDTRWPFGWKGSDVFVHDRQTGMTEMVSVDSDGNQMINPSFGPSISADGRYVAFRSRPRDLAIWDIYIHDRQTGVTEHVSKGGQVSINTDGRYVAFTSTASNLVPGDTNGTADVFVQDRQTGVIEMVSVDSDGNHADGFNWSARCAISADGRYVAFISHATNLVPGDTNWSGDVFVHDRQTGTTKRVSVDSGGNQANYSSDRLAISADGRYVAFQSQANNLVPGDTNNRWDVFVHDKGPQNTPPTANAGADQTAECTGADGASVTLDGSQSTDPDDDALTYLWAGPFGTATGATPTITIPYGTHTVTLTVDDGNGETATDTVAITVQDTTAPSTSAIISGTQGAGDWYVTLLTVDLTSTDNCSGVAELRYNLNGADTTVAGSSATITLDDGTNNLSFYAVDGTGNTEGARQLSANVDHTAPVITINGVEDGATYALGIVPVASYDATDATSGVASSGDSLTGGDGLGLGTFTYAVTASDNAGNTADAIATYEVIATEEGVSALIQQMVAEGLIAPQMENSLVTQIENGNLQAFINHVEAQTGKKIDTGAAAILINAVIYMMNN